MSRATNAGGRRATKNVHPSEEVLGRPVASDTRRQGGAEGAPRGRRWGARPASGGKLRGAADGASGSQATKQTRCQGAMQASHQTTKGQSGQATRSQAISQARTPRPKRKAGRRTRQGWPAKRGHVVREEHKGAQLAGARAGGHITKKPNENPSSKGASTAAQQWQCDNAATQQRESHKERCSLQTHGNEDRKEAENLRARSIDQPAS